MEAKRISVGRQYGSIEQCCGGGAEAVGPVGLFLGAPNWREAVRTSPDSADDLHPSDSFLSSQFVLIKKSSDSSCISGIRKQSVAGFQLGCTVTNFREIISLSLR